jgi:hypothetical protein
VPRRCGIKELNSAARKRRKEKEVDDNLLVGLPPTRTGNPSAILNMSVKKSRCGLSTTGGRGVPEFPRIKSPQMVL